MKKFLTVWGLLLFISIASYSQGKEYTLYSVAFYNLESPFDTVHDAGKSDFGYLPNGRNKWNSVKYEAKLKNMSEILNQLSTDKLPLGPAITSMPEVRNRKVLEDLLKQPVLSDRGYEIVHYEGPDRRGVDYALFYNPEFFHLTASKLAPYIYENNDTTYKARGFLIASGTLAGEKVHLIVNHWPSRVAASSARERAGEQVRALKDSLLNEDSNAKVIIMGDMNNDPMDKSMAVTLEARHEAQDTEEHNLYNP